MRAAGGDFRRSRIRESSFNRLRTICHVAPAGGHLAVDALHIRVSNLATRPARIAQPAVDTQRLDHSWQR
jgi:hypothetical protein